MIHGGTAVLVKSNVQHALIKIPMMISLQTTAIMVELNGLERVIGDVYQSPSKPFEEANYDTLIGLAKSNILIFGGDLNVKHTEWNCWLISTRGRNLTRHADRNNYAITASDSPTYYPHQRNAKP